MFWDTSVPKKGEYQQKQLTTDERFIMKIIPSLKTNAILQDSPVLTLNFF